MTLLLGVTAGALTSMSPTPATAQVSCPWAVQPRVGNEGVARFELSYEGTNAEIRHFYAFSAPDEFVGQVDDPDAKLVRIAEDGRPLDAMPVGPNQSVYQVTPNYPPDSIVYLVSSNKQVEVLEVLQAQIEPQRAIQVSRAPLFRGGSDRHGPLPPASDETELASVPTQTEFCWFVVAAG